MFRVRVVGRAVQLHGGEKPQTIGYCGGVDYFGPHPAPDRRQQFRARSHPLRNHHGALAESRVDDTAGGSVSVRGLQYQQALTRGLNQSDLAVYRRRGDRPVYYRLLG